MTFLVSALCFTAFAKVGDYGNYCGGDNTSDKKPIDAVDYICMLHDKCIDNNNTNCQCDYDFSHRMEHASAGLLPSLIWGGILPPSYLDKTISIEAAAYAKVAGPAVMVGHACNCYYGKSNPCWKHTKTEVPCLKYKTILGIKTPYPTLCKKTITVPGFCPESTHEKTFDAAACRIVQTAPGNSHKVGPYKHYDGPYKK